MVRELENIFRYQLIRTGEALFVVKRDNCLIGVCGLNIDPYAASETTGHVRHLYIMLCFS